MPPRPLNATAASLLGFLHEGPMTGWDLVAVAQQRIGNFWTLTQSQVYRELAAMAGTGLVAASGVLIGVAGHFVLSAVRDRLTLRTAPG